MFVMQPIYLKNTVPLKNFEKKKKQPPKFTTFPDSKNNPRTPRSQYYYYNGITAEANCIDIIYAEENRTFSLLS